MKKPAIALVTALLLSATSFGFAQPSAPQAPNPPTAPQMGQPQQPQQPKPPQIGQNPAKRPAQDLGFDFYRSAAQALGLTLPELRLLGEGKTLTDLAKTLGANLAKVEAALVQARNAAIDQAVKDKRLEASAGEQLKASSTAVAKALLVQTIKLPERGPDGPGAPGGNNGGQAGQPGGQPGGGNRPLPPTPPTPPRR
jgi:hypothetical protein